MTDAPKGWVAGPLRKFAPLQRGFDLPTTKVVPGDFPVVYSNGIGRFHNKAMLNGPGVVTGRSGTIGRVHFVDRDYWPHNTALWVTDFKTCAPKFVYYLLQSVGLERFAGGSGVPTLNRNDAHAFEICVPASRQEQVRIAEAVTEADDLIAALERLIAKKQAIKQGMMQQLLTGRTRLPGFTTEWREAALGDLLAYGQPGRYLVTSTDYATAGTPVLTAGKTFVLGYTQERNGIYQATPVIIFDDFTTDSKYVDFPFKAKSSAMKMLTARPGVNLRFVFERMQLINFVAVDHKRRWIAEYSKIPLAMPESDEQDAIADVIEDADRELTLLRARLTKARAIKEAMMQQLLTGRVRLPAEDAA